MATSLNTNYIPATFKVLGGGLNSTSGTLNVDDSESSDLQNIDFDKFGSILKRRGYSTLNTITLSGSSMGLHWYQGLFGEYAVTINEGKLYKMDSIDGTWDDISGAITIGGFQDIYTKLYLKMDGSDQGTTFTDSETTPKTVSSLESYDSFTVFIIHLDNNTTEKITSKIATNTDVTFSTTRKFGTHSASFNGSSSSLTYESNTNYSFSSSDYTIECWAYFTIQNDVHTMVGQYADNNHFWSLQYNFGGKLYFINKDTAVKTQLSWDFTPTPNTWHNVAICRSAGSFSAYIDGVSKSINADTGNGSEDIPDYKGFLYVGNLPVASPQPFGGNIDEVRITKDFARYNSNYTPYKSAFGVPYTVTDIKRLGTASAEIKDGTSLYLATSTDWSFSTSNFTVDTWVNFHDLTNAQILLGQYKSGTQHWYLRKQSNANSNKLQMVFVDTTSKADYSMSGAWALSKEQWNHLAFIRSSTVGTIYINGVSQPLTSVTAFGTNDVGMFTETNLRIGVSNAASYLSGNLDELRVSKETVRWTADFTPPTQQYGEFTKQDTETFLGYVLGSGQYNTPWGWSAANTTASSITVPTGLTGSQFIKKFQNYCFLGNVTVAGIRYPSRVYWSSLQDFNTWNDAEYIDISKDDGQEITGILELADRLVVYKNHSIYVIIFTGDADLPFVVQKSNSSVGCAAPFSIQSNDNGHIFAAYDGIYYFDGVNSYKLSDRISETYNGINKDKLIEATSLYQKEKNKYWISLSSGTSLYNNFILTWDSFLNAWSKYDGFSATSLELFVVGSTEERPYFADYNGRYYRADYGLNDCPLGSTTAINSYFYTNWKHYDDLCDKKGIPHVYIAHRNESNTVMTLNYSYDFYNGNEFTQSFSANSLRSVTALTTRRDLNGRGRFVRIGLSNSQTSTSFRIDGLGTYVTREGRT